MRKASFMFEQISGTVTQKDDGKISVSLWNAMSRSSATRYRAKALAQEIVKANFIHPAVYNLVVSENSAGLLAQLLSMTKDFKADFIEMTKKAAARMFENHSEKNARTYEEWMDAFGVKYEFKKYHCSEGNFPVQMDKRYYGMQNARIKSREIVSGGFAKFETKEVKYAEWHFSSAMEKLAYRLNQKGIVDGLNFEIKSARVGVNIEMTIKHGEEMTRAWTIVAEGPIQRAHFRYLIK